MHELYSFYDFTNDLLLHNLASDEAVDLMYKTPRCTVKNEEDQLVLIRRKKLILFYVKDNEISKALIRKVELDSLPVWTKFRNRIAEFVKHFWKEEV